MNIPRLFPGDFTKDEVAGILSEEMQKLETKVLTEGERVHLEKKIEVCQNHLTLLSLKESNDKLNEQQQILVQQQETLTNLFIENSKTNKRTAKEARLMIWLAIITLLATSALDWIHMREEDKNQKRIIRQLDVILQKYDKPTIKAATAPTPVKK